MKKYTVVAPYVTVRTMTNEGSRLVGLHKGAPMPADAPEDTIGYFLRDGLIEEVPGPEPKSEPKKAEGKAESDAPAKTAHGGAAGHAGTKGD